MGGEVGVPWDLSVAAQLLLLRMVDDEVAKRLTRLGPSEDEVEAFRELSRAGLAENAWAMREEDVVVVATDAGRYFVGQLLGQIRGQGG